MLLNDRQKLDMCLDYLIELYMDVLVGKEQEWCRQIIEECGRDLPINDPNDTL